MLTLEDTHIGNSNCWYAAYRKENSNKVLIAYLIPPYPIDYKYLIKYLIEVSPDFNINVAQRINYIILHPLLKFMLEKLKYIKKFNDLKIEIEKYPNTYFCFVEEFVEKFVPIEYKEDLNTQWSKIFNQVRKNIEFKYPFLNSKNFTDFQASLNESFNRYNLYRKKILELSQKFGKIYNDLNNWLDNFEESELDDILRILDNVKYISYSQITADVKELYKKLSNYTRIDKNFGYIVPVSTNRPSGALHIMYEFEIVTQMKNRCLNSIEHIKKGTLKPNEPIIIIDNFIGTGNTILNWWQQYSPYLPLENPIYIVSPVGMEEGITRLRKSLSLIHENIHIISPRHILLSKEKVLNPGYIFEEEEIPRIKKLLYKYGVKGRELGYNNSQALIAFYYRVPNNTISLLWNNNLKNPIFRR